MFQAVDSPFLVPFDGSFLLSDARTRVPDEVAPSHKDARKSLQASIKAMDDLQRRLYAADSQALLLVFQAMDAAGKDSTIRAVTTGCDPAGFQVYSFKSPTSHELDHDFLWRTATRLPERGRIGIFNRSYYEEVLIVRVHPEFLSRQRLHRTEPLEAVWRERLESIRDHELHLARNGTVVVKFFLNVSRDEQARRFVSRIDKPAKHWKFNGGDLSERGHWDAYMHAYQAALTATSREWAPWYCVPADDKELMRAYVADIVRRTLERMDPRFPDVNAEDRAMMKAHRASLAKGIE